MSKILSIEADKDKVEIHLNNEGIDFLISELNSLRENNINDHAHLMTEDWGGHGLTNIKQNLEVNSTLIHHLKIYYWEDDKSE